MFSDYKTMLNWLFQQPMGKSYPDLTHVEKVLHQLGSPHRSVPIIHVAGTNGKGSTTAYLSHILRAHNQSVATFTSPHLHCLNERFQLNHQPVSDEDLVVYMQKLMPYALTQFELFTCAFFLFIADKQPDMAIVEVGIGGLLDTTNVVNPEISIITSIGLDHVPMLGETIEDITYQKAGIIKQHTPVVIGNLGQKSLPIIDEIAVKNSAPVFKYQQDFFVKTNSVTQEGNSFTYENERYKSGLLGEHQVHNATLAIKASQILLKERWNKQLAQKGVKNTVWAGRMEHVYKKPIIYIDGAHNEEGILALKNMVQPLFPNEKVHILFGALNRKDYKQMITLLQEIAEKIHVTQFNHPQSITKEDIPKSDSIVIVDDWQNWLTAYIQKNDNQPLIVTGSLYFISEVRAYFNDCMDNAVDADAK